MGMIVSCSSLGYIGGAAKLDNFGVDLCCWTSITLSL
jgi:hypothetical protein